MKATKIILEKVQDLAKKKQQAAKLEKEIKALTSEIKAYAKNQPGTLTFRNQEICKLISSTRENWDGEKLEKFLGESASQYKKPVDVLSLRITG